MNIDDAVNELAKIRRELLIEVDLPDYFHQKFLIALSHLEIAHRSLDVLSSDVARDIAKNI
jgi:phosphoenolpyruvate synthase/pyruvate phosphate dikinase